MMMTGGVCACAAGACVAVTCAGTAAAVAVGAGEAEADGAGDALGVALACGECVGLAEARADGDGSGVDDGVRVGCVAAIVALTPGSGVKLGSELGACVPDAGLPKNRVSKPPSRSPPKITSTTSGTIGMPPPFGGSGSSRRRRGYSLNVYSAPAMPSTSARGNPES